jgi:hypothetical protein
MATSSDFPLRQLQQEHFHGLVQPLEVREREELVGIADRLPVEPVKMDISVLLVKLEMAVRMEREGANILAIAPDADCDLPRHRAAGTAVLR